jgi:hypothetical protein
MKPITWADLETPTPSTRQRTRGGHVTTRCGAFLVYRSPDAGHLPPSQCPACRLQRKTSNRPN